VLARDSDVPGRDTGARSGGPAVGRAGASRELRKQDASRAGATRETSSAPAKHATRREHGGRLREPSRCSSRCTRTSGSRCVARVVRWSRCRKGLWRRVVDAGWRRPPAASAGGGWRRRVEAMGCPGGSRDVLARRVAPVARRAGWTGRCRYPGQPRRDGSR
jgi:hypothetical protein